MKAIIFDCFGVLLINPQTPYLAELDKNDPDKADIIRSVNHATDRGIISGDEANELVAEQLGITPTAYVAMQQQKEIRNEPLIEFIKTLKPKVKVAMLSNISSRERLDIRFLPGQLDELFDVVVASGDVGYTKPQPESFAIVAEKLGVLPSDCVMVDDIEDFCFGAEDIGMGSVHFQSNEQAIAAISLLIDGGEKTD